MYRLSRRILFQLTGAAAIAAAAGVRPSSDARAVAADVPRREKRLAAGLTWGRTRLMRDPIWVYDNWSAYTDGIGGVEDARLTEVLAMRELEQVARLQRIGVHFDYYMMNAFWFAPDGAYRAWRKPDWPQGPDRWIAACQEAGLKPGLWFGSNSLWKIDLAPQWRDSFAGTRKEMGLKTLSFYEGGFLADFIKALQYWYDRGIRMFELDGADFDAATPNARRTQSPQEVRRRNEGALRGALHEFRRRNPDVMLVAFNDFGGNISEPTNASFPFKNPVDLRWLSVFDTLYCGDIRVSDVPESNFWRSVDLYSDHMVRRYEESGVPLERIDPVGFTLSTTWFGYHRRAQAWRGMLILAAARGGWKKTIYGELAVLSDEDAQWFAKVQSLYAPLLALGRTKAFGDIPGAEGADPYGFGSLDAVGSVYTVVNPGQAVRSIELPLLSRVQPPPREGRVIFRDAGFTPTLDGALLTVGPGQMAVVGFGRYAEPDCDLGIQQDVVIPRRIEPMEATFRSARANVIEATVTAPPSGDLRVIVQQFSTDGAALKSLQMMKIEAIQDGRNISVAGDQAKELSIMGISWGVGEVRGTAFTGGQPITIGCSTAEKGPTVLKGHLYIVEY